MGNFISMSQSNVISITQDRKLHFVELGEGKLKSGILLQRKDKHAIHITCTEHNNMIMK